MLDLISVGEMVIDFLPGEEAGVYIRKAGGAPANAAIAVARNGLSAGFCGRVGADDFGRFLLDTLKENQVEALCPAMVEEAVTTMAFVTLGPGGERSFTFARKPGADMFLTKADVDVALAQGARILHAGSCSLSAPPASEATAYALSQASKRGYMVSFDVNYRDLMWGGDRAAARASVAAILPYVDLLKISEEETDFMGGQEGIQAMAAETGIALAAALRLLDETDRQIVLLRNSGMKAKEIAELLDLPRGTVSWRYAESLKVLKKYLEEESE